MGKKRTQAVPGKGSKKVRLEDPGDENRGETSLAQDQTDLESSEDNDREVVRYRISVCWSLLLRASLSSGPFHASAP